MNQKETKQTKYQVEVTEAHVKKAMLVAINNSKAEQEEKAVRYQDPEEVQKSMDFIFGKTKEA